MSGVTIGDGSVIAAGAIVTHDVEPYSIVAGVPAKHIKWRFDDAIRKRLFALRWHEFTPELLKEIDIGDLEQAISVMEAWPESFRTHKVIDYMST